MPNYRIVVEIDGRRVRSGSRDVEQSLDRVEKRANAMRAAITRALAFAGLSVSIAGLVRLADQFTNIQNRIRTVTSSTAELAAVTDELLQISNRTRSSFESTAELYVRTSLAARELGLSQRQTLEFTESLNQAVILSGASAAEASAGMIQLSQGLASGTLRGDELRSVLEQLPAVADVIAQELGVTRGELRKMGEDGEITADKVITAFANAREELAERFAQTVPTIGQAFQVLQNNVTALVGEFVTASGAAAGLASLILLIGQNLENLIGVVGTAAAAWGVYRIAMIAATASSTSFLGVVVGLIPQIGILGAAQAALAGAFAFTTTVIRLMTAALLANPFTALAVAITAIIGLLYTFADDIKVTEDGVVSLGDAVAATFDLIVESVSFAVDAFRVGWSIAIGAVNELFGLLGLTVGAVFDLILETAKVAINAYIGFWTLAGKTIALIWQNFPGFMDTIFTAVVNLGASAAEALLNVWQVPLRAIAGGLSILNEDAGAKLTGFLNSAVVKVPRREASAAGQQFASDFAAAATSAASTDFIGNAWGTILERARERALARAGGPGVDLDQSGDPIARAAEEAEKKAGKTKKGTDELERQRRVLEDWARETEEEIYLLGLSNRERERAEEILRLENDLKRKLTATERELVDVRLDELQAARDAKAIRDYLDDLSLENDLLRDMKPGHEARAEALRMERDLGRELTPIERQRIIDLNEENDALARQRDIYESLNGRRDDAIRQLQQISALAASGSISEADARLARSDVGLVRDLSSLDRDLGGDFSHQAALDEIQLLEDERMRIVQEAVDARLLLEEEAAARRIAIEVETQRQIRELETARLSASLNAYESTFSSLADITKGFAGEQSRIYRAMFIVSKAFAIADSIVKIQQGIANALSLPFPANLAAAATVAAQAASIVSNIQAASAQFADGGYVSGPGTGTSDSISAMLSDGEFVVNAESTAKYRPILEAINAGRDLVPGFADGGLASNDNQPYREPMRRAVGAPTQTQSAPAIGIQTGEGGPQITIPLKIVNLQGQQEALDALQSEEGTRTILNILRENPGEVQNIAQSGSE